MTPKPGPGAFIVVDLGFGDAGKGSIVDYLVHTRDASTIIRYTGGPHAAHHIVRADGVPCSPVGRSEMNAEDDKFMQSALKLAEKGIGSVEPNPAVGCVIIKAGQVVGAGYHKKFGGPHAEINA